MAQDVTTLTDRWIGATGADGADTRFRARYQREAGVVPTQQRGVRNRPTIEGIHAAAFLIGQLVAGPQLRVVDGTRKLWALPFRRGTETSKHHVPAWMTFGQVLLQFVEMTTTAVGREDLRKRLKFINVTQNGSYASVSYNDGQHSEYFGDELPYSDNRVKFATITSVGPDAFIELGDIVTRSRREASEMNISLEWKTAYRALGFEPPPVMFPQQPLIPISSTAGAKPKTKNAVLPGAASS
jgi:hypothetical protein